MRVRGWRCNIHAFTSMLSLIHSSTHTQMYTCEQHTRTHTQMYTCEQHTHTHINVHMQTTHTHTHTYTHKRTHANNTHAHTHTPHAHTGGAKEPSLGEKTLKDGGGGCAYQNLLRQRCVRQRRHRRRWA